MGSFSYTTPGTYTFVLADHGVGGNLTVIAIGGGAKGDDGTADASGGGGDPVDIIGAVGGGGGEFAKTLIYTSGITELEVTVGAGGSGFTTDGESSTVGLDTGFGILIFVQANGGNNSVGGTGGVGDVTYDGGDALPFIATGEPGVGGGSCGAYNANGNDGSEPTGGAEVDYIGNGSLGGGGGNGGLANSDGSPGGFPGGGGGGAGAGGEVLYAGGVGAGGAVYFFWSPVEADITASATLSGELDLLPIISQGSFVLGGSIEGVVPVEISFDFSWGLEYLLEAYFDSSWDIGFVGLRYYRIETACVQPVCNKLGMDTGDENCSQGVRMMTVVAAENLQDLCRKLKNLSLNAPIGTQITSIQQYTRPVFRTGYQRLAEVGHGLSELPVDTQCNELIDVDFCGIAECIDLCLDETAVINVGAKIAKTETFYSFEMTGGINFGGRANLGGELSTFTGSGGITFGGSAEVVSNYYSLNTSGGVTFGGESEMFPNPLVRTMSGGVEFGGGIEDVQAPQYHYVEMEGEVGFGGSSYIELGLGVKAVEAGAEWVISDIEVDFLENPPESDLTISEGTVTTICGCGSLPLILELKHNFNNAFVLKDFLIRNNLTLPSVIDLRYKKKTNSWASNYHLSGLSSDGNSRENWSLLFDWSCSNTLAGEDLGNYFWILYIFFRKKNISTGEDVDTKIMMSTPTDYACVDGNLRFRAKLNTQTGSIVLDKGAIDNVVYFDEIGLFKSKFWINSPNLDILVNEAADTSAVPTYNIQPIFPI